MPFTNDNQLQTQNTGVAGWDAGLNADMQVLERGFHFAATAGAAINSGQVILINSAGFAVPYDARSLGLPSPQGMAYKSCNSGDGINFLSRGIVRSLSAVYSGQIIPGQPVFVNPASLGLLTSSFAACGIAAGMALNGTDAILFAPTQFDPIPEEVTITMSVGPILVGTFADFAGAWHYRGIVKTLISQATSCNAYKLQFFSNSTRVGTETIYNTLTRSLSNGNSVDIGSNWFQDNAMFPWKSTNTSSPAMFYGRVSCQSGSSVGSDSFSVTLTAERFR